MIILLIKMGEEEFLESQREIFSLAKNTLKLYVDKLPRCNSRKRDIIEFITLGKYQFVYVPTRWKLPEKVAKPIIKGYFEFDGFSETNKLLFWYPELTCKVILKLNDNKLDYVDHALTSSDCLNTHLIPPKYLIRMIDFYLNYSQIFKINMSKYKNLYLPYMVVLYLTKFLRKNNHKSTIFDHNVFEIIIIFL